MTPSQREQTEGASLAPVSPSHDGPEPSQGTDPVWRDTARARYTLARGWYCQGGTTAGRTAALALASPTSESPRRPQACFPLVTPAALACLACPQLEISPSSSLPSLPALHLLPSSRVWFPAGNAAGGSPSLRRNHLRHGERLPAALREIVSSFHFTQAHQIKGKFRMECAVQV